MLELAATYARVKDTMAELLGGLLADVFGGTPIDTHHLTLD